MKANEIGIVAKEHKLHNNVVTCVEQGRYCMNKFIPTRLGQTDTCIKCMQMLGEEPVLKRRKSKNIWS